MKPRGLSYISRADDRRPRSWRLIDWLLLFTVIAIIAFAVSPQFRLGGETLIDPVTGSIQKRSVWPFGVTTVLQTDVSPLEKRVINSRIPWTRHWQFLCDQVNGAIGDGPMPPIGWMDSFQQDFVNSSSDSEVQQFVQIMQTGTPAAQQAAITSAQDKVLRN